MLLPQKIARSQRSKLVGCNSENHFGSFSEVLFDLLKLAHGEPKNLLASPSKKKKNTRNMWHVSLAGQLKLKTSQQIVGT